MSTNSKSNQMKRSPSSSTKSQTNESNKRQRHSTSTTTGNKESSCNSINNSTTYDPARQPYHKPHEHPNIKLDFNFWQNFTYLNVPTQLSSIIQSISNPIAPYHSQKLDGTCPEARIATENSSYHPNLTTQNIISFDNCNSRWGHCNRVVVFNLMGVLPIEIGQLLSDNNKLDSNNSVNNNFHVTDIHDCDPAMKNSRKSYSYSNGNVGSFLSQCTSVPLCYSHNNRNHSNSSNCNGSNKHKSIISATEALLLKETTTVVLAVASNGSSCSDAKSCSNDNGNGDGTFNIATNFDDNGKSSMPIPATDDTTSPSNDEKIKSAESAKQEVVQMIADPIKLDIKAIANEILGNRTIRSTTPTVVQNSTSNEVLDYLLLSASMQELLGYPGHREAQCAGFIDTASLKWKFYQRKAYQATRQSSSNSDYVNVDSDHVASMSSLSTVAMQTRTSSNHIYFHLEDSEHSEEEGEVEEGEEVTVKLSIEQQQLIASTCYINANVGAGARAMEEGEEQEEEQAATAASVTEEVPHTDSAFCSSDTAEMTSSYLKMCSIDCEMCYTTHGLELVRVTVICPFQGTVLDEYVQPSNHIVDYNTEFSGITEADLDHVTNTLTNIHEKLSTLIEQDTVIVGHSVDCDLRALKMCHGRLVDTAALFPHVNGLPFKNSLKSLAKHILKKVIQTHAVGSGTIGHDSVEDSLTALELACYKAQQYMLRTSTTTSEEAEYDEYVRFASSLQPQPLTQTQKLKSYQNTLFHAMTGVSHIPAQPHSGAKTASNCCKGNNVKFTLFSSPMYQDRPLWERICRGYSVESNSDYLGSLFAASNTQPVTLKHRTDPNRMNENESDSEASPASSLPATNQPSHQVDICKYSTPSSSLRQLANDLRTPSNRTSNCICDCHRSNASNSSSSINTGDMLECINERDFYWVDIPFSPPSLTDSNLCSSDASSAQSRTPCGLNLFEIDREINELFHQCVLPAPAYAAGAALQQNEAKAGATVKTVSEEERNGTVFIVLVQSDLFPLQQLLCRRQTYLWDQNKLSQWSKAVHMAAEAAATSTTHFTYTKQRLEQITGNGDSVTESNVWTDDDEYLLNMTREQTNQGVAFFRLK